MLTAQRSMKPPGAAAAVVTLKASGLDGSATTGSTTTAAFTPTAGAVLVAFFSAMDEGGGDLSSQFTISDSAGRTWTSRASATRTGGYYHQGRVWTAPAGASPGSTTVTFGCSGTNHSQRQWTVIEVAGRTTVGGAAGTSFGFALSDGSCTITLSSTPAASSVIVACIGCDVSTTASTPSGCVTPGTGWTEIWEQFELIVGPDRTHYGEAQYITGQTSTSVVWNDIKTDNAVTQGVWSTSALAVEIAL